MTEAVAVSFAAVMLQMPFTIAFAWRIGAIDVPRDYRRMHQKSTPRNGGMAIWLGFLIAVAAMDLAAQWRSLLLAGGLVFLVGMIDDIRGLSPWVKLAVQGVAAVIAVQGRTGGFWAVLWILALTNAHNFIDGLDGLFGGTAAVEAFALSLLLWGRGMREASTLAVCLGGALLAFLCFNRPPARIFAGDCGSGTTGFLLGVLSLLLLDGGTDYFGGLSAVLVFAYPLTDLFCAVFRRVLRGKNPFCADRGHLHHRICDAGVPCSRCAMILVTLCAGCCGLSLLMQGDALYAAASLYCMALAGRLVALRYRIAGG